MKGQNQAEKLAKSWIDLWNRGQPESLPLAETFTHTSPFGRIGGRGHYLEQVIPIAKRNVSSLNIVKTLARSNEAVIYFEMATPKGTIQVCDWVIVEGDLISEVHSFYDATLLRE